MYRKPMTVTFTDYDKAEEGLEGLPMPDGQDSYVPDLKKIESFSKDKETFILFLMWFICASPKAARKNLTPALRRLKELIILDE